MRQKNEIKDLQTEARSKFERFIASELVAKPQVSTKNLAREFYDQEEVLLRRIATYSIIRLLVKWADDILNTSTTLEISRNGKTQLPLPFDLQGIDVPGAISFITGASKVEWVANYKALGWQMDSHAYLLRKHEEEVIAARAEFDRLHYAVKPLQDADPALTLEEALIQLTDDDKGAA